MALNDAERNRLQATQRELALWADQAASINARRQDQRVEAGLAMRRLGKQTITVRQSEGASWKILPLASWGSSYLNRLAAYTRQPVVGPNAQAWLQSLAGEVPKHLQSVKANFGLRRFFSGPSRKKQAEASARFLLQFADAAAAAGVDGVLRKLEQAAAREPSVRPADALDPSVGLKERFFPSGPVSIHAASDLKSVPNSVRRIQSAASDEEKQQKELRNLADRVRSASVQAALAEMSVDQLRTATRQRLSIAPLKKAGIDTVGAMLANPRRVIITPGIGDKTYPRLMGAARALEKETQKSTPVRIDVEEPTRDMRQLVQNLSTWEATQSLLGTPDDHALLKRLEPLAQDRVSSASHVIVAGADWELLDRDVKRLVGWANALRASEPSVADAWNDYLSRPAHYY